MNVSVLMHGQESVNAFMCNKPVYSLHGVWWVRIVKVQAAAYTLMYHTSSNKVVVWATTLFNCMVLLSSMLCLGGT